MRKTNQNKRSKIKEVTLANFNYTIPKICKSKSNVLASASIVNNSFMAQVRAGKLGLVLHQIFEL